MENKSVYEKLSIIQATIQVAKNQKNSFGNYNFRSCEDILQALKPYMNELKVVVLLSDEIKELNNGWVYIESTAKIIDTETKEEISTKAMAGLDINKKGMDVSQCYGCSSSYARKYALNGLLKLDDNKDADTNEFVKMNKKDDEEEKPQNKASKSKPVNNTSKVQKSQNELKNEAIKRVEENNFEDDNIEEVEIALLNSLKDNLFTRLDYISKEEHKELSTCLIKLCNQYGVNNIDELSVEQLQIINSQLEKRMCKLMQTGK